MAQALDLASGKSQWRAAHQQPYTMNPAATGHGKGPKSTPLIADGRLLVSPYDQNASSVLLGSQILVKDVEHLRLVRIG